MVESLGEDRERDFGVGPRGGLLRLVRHVWRQSKVQFRVREPLVDIAWVFTEHALESCRTRTHVLFQRGYFAEGGTDSRQLFGIAVFPSSYRPVGWQIVVVRTSPDGIEWGK
jgi:hypothetical protein